MKAVSGKVALVTGASRGVGKGIAPGPGEAGTTVYSTGRTIEEDQAAVDLPGTIYQTAEEVSNLGGKGIAIRCDHMNDEEVKALFQRIQFAAQKDNAGVAYGVAKAADDRMAACMAHL